MLVYEVKAEQIGDSGIYFIELPKAIDWRWSLIARTAEDVEEVVRRKIADITGKPASSFAIQIDWDEL